MATRNRGRGRNRSRGRNRARAHNRNPVTVVSRNRSRNRARVHRRHFRRNPETGFFVLGLTAAISGLVINFISPKIGFLADNGITGAVKRIALGLIGRMAATWAHMSKEVVDGIAVGGVVVGVNNLASGITGLLPNTLVPVMNVPASAVSQAQVAAAGSGVGRVVQMPALYAQGGPGLGAVRPLNRYAGYRTY